LIVTRWGPINFDLMCALLTSGARFRPDISGYSKSAVLGSPGGYVREGFLVVRNVVGTGALALGAAGLLYAGYIFVSEIPDLMRYLKIRSM
jgi:hypothetical protein